MQNLCWLLLCVAVIGGGCGPNPAQVYDQVAKQHAATLQDPVKARRHDVQETVAALRRLAKKHHRWKRAPELVLQAAGLYARREEYSAAREEAAAVCTEFPDKLEWCAAAIFLKGETFEKEEKLADAVREYENLYDRYGMTDSGLAAPLRVAAAYRRHNRRNDAAAAYQRAVQQYLGLIRKNPYGKKILPIQEYLLQAYEGTGAWQEAAGSFESLAASYPGTRCAPAALYRAADIYVTRLAQGEKALTVWRKIIAVYPQNESAQKASLRLVQYYATAGDLDTAREELNALEGRFPRVADLRAAGHLAIADGYEKIDKWQYALPEHRALQKDYPLSIDAVRSLLATARHALRENRQTEADRDLRHAAAAGEKIEAKTESAASAGDIALLLADIYGMQKKWVASAAVLEGFAQKFPADPRAAAVLFQAAGVYTTQLNNAAAAKSLYQQVAAQQHDPSLAAAARQELEKLK
jgi:TolA-binding protein